MVSGIACSFSAAVGVEYEYRGKVYRWDFSEMFGPLWLGEDFEPLDDQYRHPACACWKAFNEWLPAWRETRARKENMRRERKRRAARDNAQRVLSKLLRGDER